MTSSTDNQHHQHNNHKEQDHVDLPAQLSDLHCFTETDGVVTTTMMDLPGYRIVRVLGTVYGVTVRSRNWAAGIGMGLRSIVGGERPWFTSMLYSCRNDSISRAVEEAKSRGANAIITLRFDTGDLMGFAQACAYGTACIVEKIDGSAVLEPPQLARSSKPSHKK